MMEDYPVRSIYKLLLEQNRTPYLATIVNYLMELKSLSKESAKDTLSAELRNYQLKKKSGEVYLSMWDINSQYPDTYCLETLPSDRCEFMTVSSNKYLRCKSSAHFTVNGKRLCGNHRKYVAEHAPLSANEKPVANTNIDFLLEETDIEKLRCVAIVVKENYGDWNRIMLLAKERYKKNKTMKRIDDLEKELKQLREELK